MKVITTDTYKGLPCSLGFRNPKGKPARDVGIPPGWSTEQYNRFAERSMQLGFIYGGDDPNLAGKPVSSVIEPEPPRLATKPTIKVPKKRLVKKMTDHPGLEVRRQRRFLRIPQTKLAAQFGCPVSLVKKVENGLAKPPKQWLARARQRPD